MKNVNRIVYEVKGGWACKGIDKIKATKVFKTQAEAISSARTIIKANGGGELSIKSREGRLLSKDTILV